MPKRLRESYGGTPLHLMAVTTAMAFAAYGAVRIAQGSDALATFAWLAGAIVAHDLLAFPIYSGLNLVAFGSLGPGDRAGAVPVVNHLRIPALLSGFAFVLWFPLILRLSEDRYGAASGLDAAPYLGRWLLLTGALFLGSALVYALRMRRTRRRARAAEVS